MARRKPEPEPAAVPAAETPRPEAQPAWLDDHLRTTSPKTYAEVAIRDAVWSSFSRTQAMVREFVAEKMAEGLSYDDIWELYELQTPLAPRIVVDAENRRLRVDFETRIVERGDEGEAA